MQDRVPQTRIVKVWNVPQFGSTDASYLTLASRLLTNGKTSRLYKRLVFKDRTATTVFGFLDLREISSQFVIFADVQPGGDAKAVEKAMDEELAAFIAKGPTAAELAQEKIQIRGDFVRGAERIGGFGGTSDLLAHGQVIAGDPDEYAVDQRRIASATAEQVRDATQRWLTGGVFVLTVVPFPPYEASPAVADRTKLPDAGGPPVATLPKVERATLSNGLKIELAPRTNIPFVRLWLQLDGGFAADPRTLPGLAAMTGQMIIEGTKSRSSQQIADQTAANGSYLYMNTFLDVSRLMTGVLKDKLDPALDLFADVLLNPTFPESQLTRGSRRSRSPRSSRSGWSRTVPRCACSRH